MRTSSRNRALAVVVLVFFVTALAVVGVRPAQAAEDPVGADPAADTNAPGPVGDGADETGAAPAVDPGMDATEVAAANEAAATELAPGIVMSGVPNDAPDVADTAPAVDDNTAGLTPDSGGATADAAPAPERVLNEPYPGSSSTVTFADAGDPLADAAPLPPYLALERDSAARWREVSIDVPAVQGALAAETVEVALFDDVSVDLESTFAPSPGQLGSSMWGAAGVADPTEDDAHDHGPDGDAAIVTIVDGGIIAQWTVDGVQYGMQPLPNGNHLVYEVARAFPDDPDVLPPGPDNTNGGQIGTADASNIPHGDPIEFPTIDVLVAYDAEARAFYGNNDQTARNNIIAMVNQANVIYINSTTPPTASIQNMTLTGTTYTGVTPNTNSTQTYRDQLAAKADGNFDYIHSLRDSQAADLVALISNRFTVTDGLCGISFFPTSASPAENDAYQVTEASCALSGYTFTHEFGHNMCAGHDVTGGGCSGTYPNDKGFTDCAAGKRTVMSRNSNSCATRQPVFSNPGITYGGWVPGVATTNNANVLEQEDRAPGTVSGGIADYRTFVRGDVAVAGTDGVTCAFRTIEDAITNVAPGSTIYIAPGTHPGFTADLNYNVTKDLTLAKGTATCGPTVGGSATDVILTPAAGNTVDAVLEPSGAGTDVVLDRITIQGGNGNEGTVQVFNGSTLTLSDAVVRFGANPTSTGGGVRVLAGGTLTTAGNSQVEGNSAGSGGGISVDGGTVNLNSLGDVDTNTAASNGGGIYAINGAVVNVRNDADLLGNTASLGGGIYADNSTVLVSDLGSYIGFPGSGNVASTGGGGVFATNNALVTVESSGSVYGNTATSYAGGVRTIGGATLRMNAGGSVTGNAANGIGGGGIYASSPSTLDLNPGSSVTSNTSVAIGGGIVNFGTLDVDGGTTNPIQPVVISGNSAGTNGGGIHSSGSTNLDTARVQNNSATTSGGGAFIQSGTFDVQENFNCTLASLGFDQYCNEFRGNTTAGTGGAVAITAGTLSATQTGFASNHANEAAVVIATGSSQVGLTAVMVFANTETVVDGEALVTMKGTSTLYLIAATFAGQTEPFLDSDDTPTIVTNRVLTTTPALSLVATPFGSCNMGPAGAALPGQIIAAPVFAVDPTYPGNPTYVATNKSAYIPASGNAARDACAQLSGPPNDARGTGQLNGSGAANPASDWDIGGLEAAPK